MEDSVHEQGYFTPEVERMSARIQELIPLVGEALPRLELPSLPGTRGSPGRWHWPTEPSCRRCSAGWRSRGGGGRRRSREGCTLMRQQVGLWRETGFRSAGPGVLRLLADGLLKLGEVREALAAIEDALRLSAVTEEHLVDSELHRQRGECLWRLGRPREAKEGLLRALAIAHEQEAGFYVLRATVSLSRLLVEQGRPEEARRSLERVCRPFESSGEWAGLQEARALLDELQAGGLEVASGRLQAAP
jgi:tetratricopeptide (TPR) repeat protein